MLRTYQRIAEADQMDEKERGKFRVNIARNDVFPIPNLSPKPQDMGNLFDFSHSSALVYTPFKALHRRSYHWLPPGGTDQCEDVHTPPSRSAAAALVY